MRIQNLQLFYVRSEQQYWIQCTRLLEANNEDAFGSLSRFWFIDVLVRRYFGTVYPNKYAHGFCFAVLCCGYTLTDFPISIRLTSLALWQSNDCPSASKTTLMNMDKYFMWIHYERLHNHNKAKHSKTVCIFLGIYCMSKVRYVYILVFDLFGSSMFGLSLLWLFQVLVCWRFCILDVLLSTFRSVGVLTHYSDMIMSVTAFQISGISNIYLTVYSGADKKQNKKSIKAPCHWCLGGEFTGNQWIPLTKIQ